MGAEQKRWVKGDGEDGQGASWRNDEDDEVEKKKTFSFLVCLFSYSNEP